MHCRLKPRLNRSMKPTSWLFPEPCDGLGRHGFTFIDVGAGPSSASSTLATGPFVHLGSWCLSSDAGDCVPLTQAPRVRCIRGLTVPTNPPTKSSPTSPLGSIVRRPGSLPRSVFPLETRAAERTRIHGPRPRPTYRLGSPLSRKWTVSPGPRGSAASRGSPQPSPSTFVFSTLHISLCISLTVTVIPILPTVRHPLRKFPGPGANPSPRPHPTTGRCRPDCRWPGSDRQD